jgi:hypothetical protein
MRSAAREKPVPKSETAEEDALVATGVSPRIYLVTDADDDPQRAGFTASLNDVHSGCVVAQIRAGTRNLTWIGRAIGEALGKNATSSSSSRNEDLIWDRVSDWIAGEEISDLIINRAHLLGSGHWSSLIEMAALNDCALWLIVQQPTLGRTLSDTVRNWAVHPITWEEYESRWHDKSAFVASSGDDEGAEAELFPLVPEDDFLTFIASAERVLDRSDFRRAEGVYETEREASAVWLESVDRDESLSWAGRIRESLVDSSSFPEALTRLRAAQAALFVRGLWLKVDLRLFRLGFHGAGSQLLTAELADRLRTQTNPLWAAAAVVRAATGCSVSKLVAVPINGVARDCATVIVDRVRHSIPGYARGILRAQLQQRALDGASGDDPLFVTRRTYGEQPKPLHERGAQRVLRNLSSEIGIELVARKESWTEDDAAWLKRQGINLVVLEEGHWHV